MTVIPLTRPTIESDDVAAVENAVKAGQIGQGEVTSRFEKEFCDFVGGAGAVATSSGTSALILALCTLGVKPGDEVILPSYTCLALLNAVKTVGAEPVLVDNYYCVDSMDFNIQVEGIRACITSRTRAVIVAHMFGVPSRIDEIVKMGVPVIEDGTLCLGAHYNGRPIGRWGQISVFSLHASKMLACGEGGMLVARGPLLYERARYLNSWVDEQAGIRLNENREFEYDLRYSYRLSDMAAALGIQQLRKLPRFIARRRQIAALYTGLFAEFPNLKPPLIREDSPNAFHRFIVALKEHSPTEVIQAYARYGIEIGRGVYPPLHRYLKSEPENFAGAETAVRTLVSIPLYPGLLESEIDYLFAKSCEVFAREDRSA